MPSSEAIATRPCFLPTRLVPCVSRTLYFSSHPSPSQSLTYPRFVRLVGLVEPVLVEADDVGVVDGLQAVEDGRDPSHVLLAVLVLREPNLLTHAKRLLTF